MFPLDVSEVEKHLHPLAADWQQLGRELELPSSLLEQIAREGGNEECLGRVVREWASSTARSPCWATLVGSLHTMQMKEIATQILSSHGEKVMNA